MRRAPGIALADSLIFRLVAEYWGCREMFRAWTSPHALFEILKRLSRGQPCDMTGLGDYGSLIAAEGIQWPWPEGGNESGPPASERRLFGDGRFFHGDGRARFVFESPRPMPEPPNQRFPLVLLTGRATAAQWHTQTRTSKSAVLRRLYPAAPYVEIHPGDARARDIQPNSWVMVESQRASLRAKAFVTPL